MRPNVSTYRQPVIDASVFILTGVGRGNQSGGVGLVARQCIRRSFQRDYETGVRAGRRREVVAFHRL